MRVKSTLKNGFYAVCSSLSIAVLAVFVRRLFVQYLSVDYLGYEGLFGNIFALLSLMDLGIPILITYRLYPAFASGNKEKIQELLAVNQYIYRAAGLLVFAAGAFMIPFLPAVIRGDGLDWHNIYIFYSIQLACTLCTYFLAYTRVLYSADQKEYQCIRIETACNMIAALVKIFVILFTKSYVMYLLAGLFYNISVNGWIYIKSKKDYGVIPKRRVTLNQIKELGILHDLKNNIVQEICLVIYGGTDNIIISAFLGISQAGRMASYTLISAYVANFTSKLASAFQASIGNYIYSQDRAGVTKQFRMFDMMAFVFASFAAVSYMVLFQPVIRVWLGDEFLLDSLFVYTFAANQYIGYNHMFLCMYRNSLGRYEVDKPYILAGTAGNLVFSVILSEYFGVAGVMMGTIFGHLGFWIGRVKVVYTQLIQEHVIHYAARQAVRLTAAVLECMSAMILSGYCMDGISGIVQRIGICLIVPNGLNYLLFFRTTEGKDAVCYARIVWDIVWSRRDREK